jgi:hypothetical protein
MVDIKTNLLKNRHTLSEKEYEQERKYLRYAIVSLIMVVVMVVALSIWNLVLAQGLSKTEKSITMVSKEMQGLTQASAQQIYLKSRLKLVTGFLADKSLTRESLQKVLSISIPGVHVGALTFESDSVLAVQYVSDSVSSLKGLLNYFENDTGYFLQAVSRGLTRAKDGSYQMSVALTLPKGDK